jgi:hypothetical protein
MNCKPFYTVTVKPDVQPLDGYLFGRGQFRAA